MGLRAGDRNVLNITLNNLPRGLNKKMAIAKRAMIGVWVC
ncbi:protein of unknown function [Limnospira indica PCC 8005]|uniref:Uncharacterized protein n=1 Tax=Limnospira indica PCC 8005 TaxID=376219 RepID=A0A9P1KDM6_9CYAN|nr:protein of unknown function [Limnospira indica PCC 8005]